MSALHEVPGSRPVRTVRAATTAIRAVRREDVPAVTAIYNEGAAALHARPRESAEIHVWFADRLPFLVARDERDRVIGWARMLPVTGRRSDPRVGEQVVYVTTRARRRGVATALVRELCRPARQAGFHHLIGWVPADSPAARATYRAAGFIELASRRRRSGLFRSGEDWILVARPLPPAAERQPLRHGRSGPDADEVPAQDRRHPSSRPS